jgi:hypothetical protein
VTTAKSRGRPHDGPIGVLVGTERFSEHHAWSEMPIHWPPCVASRAVIEVVGQGELESRLVGGGPPVDVVVPVWSVLPGAAIRCGSFGLVQQFGVGGRQHRPRHCRRRRRVGRQHARAQRGTRCRTRRGAPPHPHPSSLRSLEWIRTRAMGRTSRPFTRWYDGLRRRSGSHWHRGRAPSRSLRRRFDRSAPPPASRPSPPRSSPSTPLSGCSTL